jgi:predicted CopG family antitoxin
MSQQPPWAVQPQPQHPSKMRLPRTAGRVIFKITTYFVGAIIAEFFLLSGAVGASSTLFDCIAFSLGVVALIGSITIFFHKEYYLHCLPGVQYLYWMLGVTGIFLILFVTAFAVSNPNKNPIASAIAAGILVLYGISFMCIAHLKPPLAQQVNESVYYILKKMPGKQIDASDLLARLQKKYKEGASTLNQYIGNLEYIELINISGIPNLIWRMKPQKTVAAIAPILPTPLPISHSPVAPLSQPSQLPVKQPVTPQTSQPTSPADIKPEAQRFVADQAKKSVLPAAMQNSVSLSSPPQNVVPPNVKPTDVLPPLSTQDARPSGHKLTDKGAPFMPPVAFPHPKLADTVPPPAPAVTPASPVSQQKAIQIFCCYAHEDERLLDKLKTHLQPQQRQGLIHIWYDRDISAGAEWEKEIEQQLNNAQVILLLVSPDFMASDYCYNKEMQHVLERHARGEVRAIPIILRPTDWRITPLGKLQPLPKDGKAITNWLNRDDAYLEVATGIRTIIETLLTPPQQSQKQILLKNNVQNQKSEEEVELIRTRCSQGKLIVTNKKIAVELTVFGNAIKSQILLRSSLASIDSKVVIFPVFGAGGGMNLTFYGKGREIVKAELVPFKQAQEVLALLS